VIDKLLEGAFDLAGKVATEIAKKTGADEKVSKEVAVTVAKAWVAQMKADVTAARERARKRVKGK
jgi:hypothetical protein